MAKHTQEKKAAAEGQGRCLGDGAGSVGRQDSSNSRSNNIGSGSSCCKLYKKDKLDTGVSWGGAKSLSRPTRGRVLRCKDFRRHVKQGKTCAVKGIRPSVPL